MTTSGEDRLTGQELLLRDCLQFLAMTILCWDHILTFGDEVRYFWAAPKIRSSYLFFANRYLALIVTVTFTPLQTFANLSNSVTLAVLRPVALVLCGALVTILISLRIYALYNRSRVILGIMLCSGTMVLSVALWSFMSGRDKHNNTDHEAPESRVAVWMAFLAHDSLNFVLTAWKSWSVWKEHGMRRMNVPLLSLMIRDGVMYYAMVCGGYLANIITFYAFPEPLHASLSSFAGCIAVTITSRIFFNLHKTAEGSGDSLRNLETTNQTTPNTTAPEYELTTLWLDDFAVSVGGGRAERDSIPVAR